MKKQKKIFISIIVFLVILLSGCQAKAINILDGEIELSQSYLEYLELSEEEKKNVIAPSMYDISKSNTIVTNPLKIARMLGSSLQSKYSLREIIPENMVIKNQGVTNTCWTFSSLASLESNLALKDYKNGITTPIVYDFSERHMDYATSSNFLNNAVNEFGFNRNAGSGGVIGMSTAYLTNGLGAISEEEMKFQSIIDVVEISEIQNKNVITQVNDIVTFPSYSATDDKTQIKQQMKEHIMNNGAINASINGSYLYEGSKVYNSQTAAFYCNSTAYKIDHAVAIVGWNDEYPVENFVEGNRPTNNGAWIAKNSWGTTSGDEGYIYISYEDVNVYTQLTGIEDAQTEIEYENIYQYDEFGGYLKFKRSGASKIYLATEFDKKSTEKEYLTQISVNAAETYTCKIYVNPNGTSKSMSDLQQVELKTGETEKFEAGYHTIEFLNPIKINADSFVVVLEIEGAQSDSITAMVEINFGEFFTDSKYANAANHVYDNVTIANEKCFITTEEEFNNNQWTDASKMYEISEGKLPNFDTTIKAFTTSKVLEKIEITTPPAKTTYIEGQDFDKTGIVVSGIYANGDVIEIDDYSISNGTDLELGQTSVTVTYNNFTTTQPIEVVANTVENIIIKTPPTKTEYWAGDSFDATGMTVEAIYKDGTTKNVTEYIINDGETLKNNQTTVTIEYGGKTVTQEITVNTNTVEKLEIVKAPNKTNYVVRQNFDSTGMIIKATYKNGTTKEIGDYTIKNGTDLQVGQTSVTIEFEGQTVTQSIIVVEKSVTGITIKTLPTKTEYFQNKEELDLTNGVIEVEYNDGEKEEILMTSEKVTVSGFNNKELGKQTIILTYEEKTTQFEIQIKELPKPQNSILDDVKANIKEISAHYYTDENQKEYAILRIEMNDIIKAMDNEKIEYYYYLSLNPSEENITNWMKINISQEAEDKILFEINSSDITNYEELLNSNTIYLYVKEVATRNDIKVEAMTKSLALSAENINIEKYMDGEKLGDINSDEVVDSTPGEEPDNTLASGTIPNAGKSIAIMFLAVVIIIIGRFAYLKYKDIEV